MLDAWVVIGLASLTGIIGGALSRLVLKRIEDAREPLKIITASSVVATGEFILARDGKVRAQMGLSNIDGSPFLKLLDKQEKVRVGLVAADQSISGLVLSDRHGNNRITIGTDDYDACRLHICDDNDNERGSLVLDKDNSIHLKLCDPLGETKIMLNVTDDGAPGIILIGDAQNAKIVIANSAENILWETPPATPQSGSSR